MDGVEQGVGPGPVAVEVKPVEQPVSNGLWGGAAELSSAADALRPGEEIVRCEAELHPDVVVDDVIEGQVRQPGRFRVADGVLGAGTLALLQLERGEVDAGLVGDERGVAHAFDGVEQRKLSALVRAFAAQDQPGPGQPGVEIDERGELDNFGVVTTLAVGFDGRVPAAGWHTGDAVAYASVDLVAEGELDVEFDVFLGEPARLPGRVRPEKDPVFNGSFATDAVTGLPQRWQLGERVGEQHDVISGGVRSGVAPAESVRTCTNRRTVVASSPAYGNDLGSAGFDTNIHHTVTVHFTSALRIVFSCCVATPRKAGQEGRNAETRLSAPQSRQ